LPTLWLAILKCCINLLLMEIKNEIVIENTKDELVLIVDENDNLLEPKSRKEMVNNKYIVIDLIIFRIKTFLNK
jgi:hypothetical protein